MRSGGTTLALLDRETLALHALLATYGRMERATASKADWIELEVAVNRAFIDAVDAAAQEAADRDGARRVQEHMNALISLRKRIEGQVALAEARERSRG